MNDKNGDIDTERKFKMPSKIRSYKIEKELYTVSGAHVCLGTNTNINEKVLIKIYDKEIINYKPEELTLINNEIHMMKIINHKNALNLYEIIESPSYIFLIMEYFNGSVLLDYIYRKKKLSEDEALNIYKQIISFLLYIHEMNLGHLDLNDGIILVDNSNNIKICEFKYCVFYTPNQRVKITTTGDKFFLAPECYSKKSCLPELADMWSSGVLLYSMTVGELPFYHQNELDLQKIILKGEYRLPSNMDTKMQDFIKALFEEEEDSRYNLNKIFNSELFKQNNINKNNFQNGLNILTVKYPIDERVMNICQSQFGLDPEDIKKKLFNNIFDPYTSLYKQIISKFNNKKIANNADLTSKKFNSYIKDENNYLDKKLQKKYTQSALTKEFEYKIKNKDKESDINKNLQKALIGLDELLKTYSDPEKKKQRESKSVDIAKKRTVRKGERKETEKKLNRDIKKKPTLKRPNKQGKTNNDKRVNIANVNKGRRMTSNINIDEQLKSDLDKFKKFQMNQNKIGKKNAKKNLIKKSEEVIKETEEEAKKDKEEEKDEEDFFVARKRNRSFRTKTKVPKIIEASENNSSDGSKGNSKRNSVEKKERQIKFAVSNNKVNNNNQKNSLKNKSSKKVIDNIENIDSNIESEKKDSKKSKKNKKKDKENEEYIAYLNLSMYPMSQFGMMKITKDEFFNQIKGVKLKKMVPNKYYDPDEIKRKDPKKKGEDPIEKTAISMKNAKQVFEDKQKNKRGLTEKKDLKNKNNNNPKISSKDVKKTQNDLKNISKQMELKYNNPAGGANSSVNNRKRANAPRKSVNIQNAKNNLVLKNKGVDFRDGEIKKVKTIRFKNMKYNNDIIFEEEGNIETPKFKKKSEKKINNIIKEEKKNSIVFEEDTKRKKKEEEEEQEKRNKKEREEKRRREDEEKKRKEEEEERKRKEDEEKVRKEEEEQRRLRKAENEKKRLKEEEENRRILEEYDNKQREEKEKKKNRENLKKQKEEEMRIKREKDALERRNKLKANLQPKLVVKKPVSDSESEGDSEDSTKVLKKKSKTDRVKHQKSKDKKKFNYHANPFDIYKKNTIESDDDSSIDIKINPSIKKKKTNKDQIKKKKSYRPKINDFNKFRESDKIPSESISFESSDKEIVKKKTSKKEKKALNKSVENRNKNSMFDKYTDYFFNENTINEGKLKKKLRDKENMALAEKNAKKGFYHYQNNPKKVEKRVVDEKFEVRMKNLDAISTLKPSNTTMVDNKKKNNNDNSKKMKTTSNLNDGIKNNEKQLFTSRMNRDRNNNSYEKRQNNTIAYNHKATRSELEDPNKYKNKIIFNRNNNGLKRSIKRLNVGKQKNNIVQNLMNDFDQTMNDYPQYQTINNMTSRGMKKINYNKTSNKYNKENSKSIFRHDFKKKKSKNNFGTERSEKNEKKLNHNKTEYDERNKNKTNEKNKSIKTLISKDKQTNNKTFKEKKPKRNDADREDSENSVEITKPKKTNRNLDINIKDLPVYDGEIDYNNTSFKDIPETINDLMERYKKKGYTCIKRVGTVFKFIKGPKIHLVELMSLGNGLLYLNISKKK